MVYNIGLPNKLLFLTKSKIDYCHYFRLLKGVINQNSAKICETYEDELNIFPSSPLSIAFEWETGFLKWRLLILQRCLWTWIKTNLKKNLFMWVDRPREADINFPPFHLKSLKSDMYLVFIFLFFCITAASLLFQVTSPT